MRTLLSLRSDVWRRVGLVRTDVLGNRVASIFRMERILEVGTTVTVTSRLLHSVKKHELYGKGRWNGRGSGGVEYVEVSENVKPNTVLT
jgi:hypothetical protein